MPTVSSPIVIVGAGDHGRVVLELLRAAGEAPIGFVEPRPRPAAGNQARNQARNEVVGGLPVVGDLEDDLAWRGTDAHRFVCAIGDNRARAVAFERCLELGLTPAACVHPAATLLMGAAIEAGAMVCAGAIVGVDAWVGPNAIVNTAASVDHDNRIGAHATIAPGAHLAGRVVVGEGAYVGIGAAVREGSRIGDWALVAGGAMVAGDVPDGARVAGVPARPMTEHIAR